MSTSRMLSERSLLEMNSRAIAGMMLQQDLQSLTIWLGDLSLTYVLPSGTKQLSLSYPAGQAELETSSEQPVSKIVEGIFGKAGLVAKS